MVHLIGWGIFLVSLSALILLILRSRHALAWLVTMGMHVVVAAVLLYILNGLGQSVDFHIPINGATVATIGLLGIPGLLLLTALKLTLVR